MKEILRDIRLAAISLNPNDIDEAVYIVRNLENKIKEFNGKLGRR